MSALCDLAVERLIATLFAVQEELWDEHDLCAYTMLSLKGCDCSCEEE